MKWLRSPKIPIWTSLPTGMTAADDGRTIKFLADQTAGVVWDLRYRHFQADGVTVNPSSYKWEYIGGPPLKSLVAAGENNIAGSGYNDLATVGPDLIAPLAGEYDARISALCWTTGAGPVFANTSIGLALGATGSIVASAIGTSHGSSTQDQCIDEERIAVPTANQLLRLRYGRVAVAYLFGTRRIILRPVRVG
jgi:hypothetical protein